MCGRGRAGVRQERTAQYGGRMFVFATTQGVQGDMPSAIARGLRENPKSTLAPWGTSACSHEGGTVAVSLVFVSVFREAYDRTKPTEEGRASALRGRLQSVDPTKLNNALAPRAAGRAEASLRALLLVLWRATRTGREKEVARFVRALRQRRCQRTPRLHLGASLLPWDTTLLSV